VGPFRTHLVGRCGLGFCFGRRLRLPRLGQQVRPGRAPAQQARSHDRAGIRKTRRTLPSVDFEREGGQSLFRILGDGNHQSRHVREHAEQVRAYLEANLTQDLDMNTVARAASLSPFYLTRILKQRYGVPPYRYDRAPDRLRV
jgi:transcriptional regulator GlxA family with amidase domain